MVSHVLLLRVVHAGVPACKTIQFIARGIVPAKKHDPLLHISSRAASFPQKSTTRCCTFQSFFERGGEPVAVQSVSCRGTRQGRGGEGGTPRFDAKNAR